MGADWPGRVRTVLLDAGGVLLDLDLRYLARLIEAGRPSAAPPIDETELARIEARARRDVQQQVAQGGRLREAWRDYFHLILGGMHVPVERQPAIVDALWEAHQRFGLWTVPIPGSREAVAELRRRGFEVGVVSNAEGRVERDLDAAGYAGMFATVVDSHVVGVEKPDPRIFAIALERMGAEPATTIFVGDLPAIDVEGARAAGITPVLVDAHGLYASSDARRIGSLSELPGLLDGHR